MTAKACPSCGQLGDTLYCKPCRSKGHIVMLKTASQLQAELNRMRKHAETIKAAIRALRGEE